MNRATINDDITHWQGKLKIDCVKNTVNKVRGIEQHDVANNLYISGSSLSVSNDISQSTDLNTGASVYVTVSNLNCRNISINDSYSSSNFGVLNVNGGYYATLYVSGDILKARAIYVNKSNVVVSGRIFTK